MANEGKFDERCLQEHDALSFSIGEVAKMLGVEAHTIRFWEKTFRIVVPRSNSNRRCYTRSDVTLLKKIQRLVHKDGLSLHSAYHQLVEEGQIPDLPMQEELSLAANPASEAPKAAAAPAEVLAQGKRAEKTESQPITGESQEWMRSVREELRGILALLRG